MSSCLHSSFISINNNNKPWFIFTSGLQLNLFWAFTFCGEWGFPHVRYYSAHLIGSTEVFIFLENILANRRMSRCVTGCVTDQYKILYVIAPCTCITIHSIQPSSLTTPFLRYPLSIATSYPSCCLLLSCSLSPVEK